MATKKRKSKAKATVKRTPRPRRAAPVKRRAPAGDPLTTTQLALALSYLVEQLLGNELANMDSDGAMRVASSLMETSPPALRLVVTGIVGRAYAIAEKKRPPEMPSTVQ